MINKTRKKFIYVTMSLLFAVLLMVGFAIAFTMHIRDSILTSIALSNRLESDGKPDDPSEGQGFDEMRGFTVKLSLDQQILSISATGETFSKVQIEKLVSKIIQSKKLSGNIGSLCYKISVRGDVATLVAIDRSIEKDVFSNTLVILAGAGCIMFLCLFLIVWKLSFWIVKPVQEAFDRQNQFVSDASHELKTPITIISANAEVLRSEIGESKWLENIQSQSLRMNALILEMLQLAKLKEQESQVDVSQFNLSRVVSSAVMAFDALAFETNKTLDTEIKPDIMFCGNESEIKKILEILVDNAVKYADDVGLIKVSLSSSNNKSIVLKVFNTGCDFLESEKDKLFERFYRSDFSRDRQTGGSGLGLAIVKSIVDENNWKLSIDCEQGKFVQIQITLNCSL